MKWLLSLILVLLAVGTLRVVGCGDGGEERGVVTCSRIEPCTVWLLGDSNTVAMAWSFEAVDLDHPEYRAINLANDGQSAASALDYVERQLDGMLAPDIAIVTYGGMDIIQGHPTAPTGATALS